MQAWSNESFTTGPARGRGGRDERKPLIGGGGRLDITPKRDDIQVCVNARHLTMTIPNLSKVVGTFIPWCDARDAVRLWPTYFSFLRGTVRPIVRQLQREAKVGWFSFLVHTHASGVPCNAEDTRLFIQAAPARWDSPPSHRLADLNKKAAISSKLEGVIEAGVESFESVFLVR